MTEPSYTLTRHGVTGDPYIHGDVMEALADFGGIVTITASRGDYTVKGWAEYVDHYLQFDPDTVASSRDLEDALRFVLGELLNRKDT